jgi:hypothetical protein
MILDSIDLIILQTIYSNKETTTWEMTKQISWEDRTGIKDVDLEDYWNRKDTLIRLRLKSMAKEGIIKIEKNGSNSKNIYILDINKVKFCKRKFPDNRLYNCVYIQLKDFWICRSIK